MSVWSKRACLTALEISLAAQFQACEFDVVPIIRSSQSASCIGGAYAEQVGNAGEEVRKLEVIADELRTNLRWATTMPSKPIARAATKLRLQCSRLSRRPVIFALAPPP
jgi:hypothetical protein